MDNKNKTVNTAMLSENNSNKLLRIFETDVAKLVACGAGLCIAPFLPGILGGIGMIVSGFGAIYYGAKTFFRLNRVKNEDNALAHLETQSPATAQQEIERQHASSALNITPETSHAEQLSTPPKKGMLAKLKAIGRRRSRGQEENAI